MRQYINTLKKLAKLEVNFNSVNGWFKLDELIIREKSGYAVFKDKKDPEITIYITVIASNREEVVRELTNKILTKLFWTSRLDMSWVKKD